MAETVQCVELLEREFDESFDVEASKKDDDQSSPVNSSDGNDQILLSWLYLFALTCTVGG